MKTVIKDWGVEYWIVNETYCGKKLKLFQGMQCSLHHHKIKDETFYVVSGEVAFELDGETKTKPKTKIVKKLKKIKWFWACGVVFFEFFM